MNRAMTSLLNALKSFEKILIFICTGDVQMTWKSRGCKFQIHEYHCTVKLFLMTVYHKALKMTEEWEVEVLKF